MVGGKALNTSGVKYNLWRWTPQCTWKTGASGNSTSGRAGESNSFTIILPLLQLLASQYPSTDNSHGVDTHSYPSMNLEARMQIQINKFKMKHFQKIPNGCAAISQYRSYKPAKILSPTTQQMQVLYKRTDATDIDNDTPCPHGADPGLGSVCRNSSTQQHCCMDSRTHSSKQCLQFHPTLIPTLCKDKLAKKASHLVLPRFLLAPASLQRHDGFDDLSTDDDCMGF